MKNELLCLLFLYHVKKISKRHNLSGKVIILFKIYTILVMGAEEVYLYII